jgi:hypothetical protein
VPRDELIREALKALATCCDADKELDGANTVVGVVGRGETFHLLEGAELAPFLVGIAAPAAVAAAAAAAAAEGSGGEAAAAAAPVAAGLDVEA